MTKLTTFLNPSNFRYAATTATPIAINAATAIPIGLASRAVLNKVCEIAAAIAIKRNAVNAAISTSIMFPNLPILVVIVKKSPANIFIPPPIPCSPITSARRFKYGTTFSITNLANRSTTGINNAPNFSATLPKATCIFSKPVAEAAAVPPTCDSTSFKISFCAPNTSPEATRVLICSFCCSVKLIPARRNAVIPFSGSLNALPSCIAAASAEPNTLPKSCDSVTA